MTETIVLTNPFIRRAFYVEPPFTYIDNHWVTKEFGFKAFRSGRESDCWIYFMVGDNQAVKATPEFLDDTEAARFCFSRIK